MDPRGPFLSRRTYLQAEGFHFRANVVCFLVVWPSAYPPSTRMYACLNVEGCSKETVVCDTTMFSHLLFLYCFLSRSVDYIGGFGWNDPFVYENQHLQICVRLERITIDT